MITDAETATMTETTTISVPEEIADELYARKARGESYADVIRQLLEGETDGTDKTASDRRETETSPDPTEASASDEPEPEVTFEVIVETVGADVLPGTGSKLDARKEAFLAAAEYLREHGTIKKATFEDHIYPDHNAEYQTARSAWKNCIYPGLRTLSERADAVEAADESGVWRWTGE
jgi:predicted CopG family antitoxin